MFHGNIYKKLYLYFTKISMNSLNHLHHVHFMSFEFCMILFEQAIKDYSLSLVMELLNSISNDGNPVFKYI
jgi:hypothetical protein